MSSCLLLPTLLLLPYPALPGATLHLVCSNTNIYIGLTEQTNKQANKHTILVWYAQHGHNGVIDLGISYS